MPTTWSGEEMPAPKLAKPRPQLLDKRAKAAKVKTQDQQERDKCHDRSGGQCEVREKVGRVLIRCTRPVAENHHLLGGNGRRNKGRSILAAHRLDTCLRCHTEITRNVLKPVDGTKKDRAKTVTYERVK